MLQYVCVYLFFSLIIGKYKIFLFFVNYYFYLARCNHNLNLTFYVYFQGSLNVFVHQVWPMNPEHAFMVRIFSFLKKIFFFLKKSIWGVPCFFFEIFFLLEFFILLFLYFQYPD